MRPDLPTLTELAERADEAAWSALLDAFDDRADAPDLPASLAAAERLLAAWPDTLRRLPPSAWRAVLDGERPPWWPLVRCLAPPPYHPWHHLTDIEHITALDLSGHTGGWGPLHALPALRHIEAVERPGLRRLQGLERALGLARLSVRHNRGVVDLSPLGGLDGLTWLDLDRCGVVDPGPLAGCSALSRLVLSRCPLATLAPLGRLPRLAALDLRAAGGQGDLSPLAGAPMLTELKLGGAPLGPLDPLARCPRLERLSLRGLPASADLTPLAAAPALREVALFGCAPELDLGPLGQRVAVRVY